MWTELKKTDSKDQYLTAMYAMDKVYLNILSANRIDNIIDYKRGKFYVYTGTGFVLVIAFKYSSAIDMYKLMNIGISGNADPVECARLVLEKMKQFATENNLKELYAIKPLKMDNVEILKVHDEILKYSWVYKDEITDKYIKVRFEIKESK